MDISQMKTCLPLLSSALLLAITSSAFAASSVDLTVKGLITPSACTPNLPGAVDYGKIAAKDLNPDSHTWLEDQTLQLSVNCEAATLFAINPVDNRAGSSTVGRGSYGLGLANGTEKLGGYQLMFSNPVAETPSTLLYQYEQRDWAPLYPEDPVEDDMLVALGSRGDSGWAPHPVQDALMDITVHTAVAPANGLSLANEVALDGSTTFEVMYL
jgi:type 1 fimbria pilin